jgi:hypothetical protein
MFAIFLFVRTMNRLRDKKPANTRACPYCKSNISNEATKCAFCCSDVEPVEVAGVEDGELKKGLKSLKKVAVNVAGESVAKIKKITKR